MTTTTRSASGVSAQLLELAATGRPRPAIDYVLELIADGLSVDRLITETLTDVQREVGRLWQANEWTVAQEHAATAVIDGVLGAVSMQTNAHATSNRGCVLVACVEEEYHSLPARMGAERLRYQGWEVTFLGASVPAHDLQQYVVDTEPDRIVLSCTLSLHLSGAARGIAALADLGAPVIVAGAAFGDTPDRAGRVGASAWIGPDTNPSALLEAAMPTARSRPLDHPDSMRLALCSKEIAEACMTEIFAAVPASVSYSSQQVSSTRTDLDYILRYLALAIDLDETQVFDEFVPWLAQVLSSRNVPPRVLIDSLGCLGGVLDSHGHQRSAALCGSAQTRLAGLEGSS
jgi:methanogenic corrinoid protein MtbC1